MMATTMMVMAMMAVAGIATKVMPMPAVMLTNACCNLEHIKLLNAIVFVRHVALGALVIRLASLRARAQALF